MKATSQSFTTAALAAALTAALATAACANEAQSEPEAYAQTQPTLDDAYLDAPQTPGMWSYYSEPGETLALYDAGQLREVFMLRCGDGALSLARITGETQTEARAMAVVTETVTGKLTVEPVPQMPNFLAADLNPDDPLLDAMAITKGRFAIEVEGFDTLYIPAWVEVSRVIEDCR